MMRDDVTQTRTTQTCASKTRTTETHWGDRARLIVALALAAMLFAASTVLPDAAEAQPIDARPEPEDALTVMSFNIASHHDCAKAQGCLYDDPDHMLDVVADLIVENGVDVAGLQEVERFTNRHNGADMAQVLADKLAERGYPMFWWFEARVGIPVSITTGDFGIALFSRMPADTYSSTMHASSIHASSAPVQQAVFTFEGNAVRVYNSHAYVQMSCDVTTPGMVTPVQDPAGGQLDEFTVLLGDFNDGFASPCMNALFSTHASVCHTFPGPAQAEAIDPTCAQGVVQFMHPNGAVVDYVLYRFASGAPTSFLEGWVDQAINDDATAYPGDYWVSDHYPIFGRFDLASEVTVMGDVTCDGSVDVLDAVAIAQHVSQLRHDSGGCPLTDPATEMNVAVADVDVSGEVNVFDAVIIAECVARLNNVLCPVTPAN